MDSRSVIKTRLLIEKQRRGVDLKLKFRLCERECTSTGFSRTNYFVIGENYEHYDHARDDFNIIKRGRNEERPLSRLHVKPACRYHW